MRGSVESPFEAQLQETVAMELNTGGPNTAAWTSMHRLCFHLIQVTQTSAGSSDLLRSCVELIEGSEQKIAPAIAISFHFTVRQTIPGKFS